MHLAQDVRDGHLLGVATPSDLIRDTRTTPFNIGQRIELHDFTRKEASQLGRGLKRNERLASFRGERAVFIHNALYYWGRGFMGEGDHATHVDEFIANSVSAIALGDLFLRAAAPAVDAGVDVGLVQMSSASARIVYPGYAIYGASKAAVKLMTEGLWAELQGTNVHVTVVFPGAVATNITANSGVDIPGGMDAAAMEKAAARTLPADKAAKIILDGMEKNAYRVMVGSDAKLMDRLYRLNPRRATGFITRQMKQLLK